MEREATIGRTFDADALYRTEGPRVWRAVYAYSRDAGVTDDAVAEAFAQCLRRGNAVSDPRAWVWRAAFRIAAGDLKRRGRESLGNVPDRAIPIPDDTASLLDGLRSLPERQRACLVLRHYAGYSSGEIAEMLGIGTATVRVHLSRGARKLRALLQEDEP